jgi:hypothetical protein
VNAVTRRQLHHVMGHDQGFVKDDEGMELLDIAEAQIEEPLKP